MMRMILSQRKAEAAFFLILVMGGFILYFGGYFWPELAIVIGTALAFKQFLLGKRYEMYMSIIVFLGLYMTWESYLYRFSVDAVEFFLSALPVLFLVSAIFLIFREYVFCKEINQAEEDEEEEVNHEIEEEQEH